MKFCATTLVLLFVAMPLIAADPSGNWSGSVTTPNGELPVSFSLKADGEKLTGTMGSPDGSQFPIAEGKIDGNNISFSVTLDFNGNSFSLGYKGVVTDDQIAFTSDFNGQSFQFVVKRTL